MERREGGEEAVLEVGGGGGEVPADLLVSYRVLIYCDVCRWCRW